MVTEPACQTRTGRRPPLTGRRLELAGLEQKSVVKERFSTTYALSYRVPPSFWARFQQFVAIWGRK